MGTGAYGAGEAREEIGRIDFLLDDLARAVERGEIPRESYNAVAPRHLARRAELTAPIELARTGWQQVRAPVQAQAPSSRPVQWTQVLAYTGAFLVVVAAAIFTVAVWETVSTTAKLGFLGVFTLGFYAAGVWAWRTGMQGGGVALAAVGSAMLLFDGWIAIDGYGLSGVWPWAVLLLVLSAVYWLTEVWMSGRFFGATGAAAQVGWWWLLGQGLGWTYAPRLAGIAAVAAVWVFAAERIRGREGYLSLASVLRIAGPVVVAGAAVGILLDIPIGPPRWIDVLSAAVVALAVTAVAYRRDDQWRMISALGAVPLLSMIMAMAEISGPSWATVGALAGLAVAAGAYGLLRDGRGHVTVAVTSEFAAWLVLAGVLNLSPRVTVAVLGVVALSWLIAARLLAAWQPGPRARETDRTAIVVAAAGWLLLGGATLLAFGGGFLSDEPSVVDDAVLAWWMLGLWAAAGVLARSPVAAGAVAAVSVWATVISSVVWIDSGWDAWAHPAAALAVAAVWGQVRAVSARMEFDRFAPSVARAIAFGVGVWCVVLAAYHLPDGEWGLAGVAAALAVFWLADALRSRDALPVAGVGPSLVLAGFAAAAAAVTGPVDHVAGVGMIAGAAAGAVWAGVTVAARSRIGAGAPWSAVAAAVAASVLPLTFFADPLHLAVGFALVALSWAACVPACRSAAFALVAALAGALSVASLLSWGDASALITVLSLTGVSAAMLAPSIRVRSGIGPPLAIAGALVALATAALGLASYAGLTAQGTWLHLGPWGAVAALTWLGAALVTLSAAYRIEIAEYLGAAAVLLAAFIVLDTVGAVRIAPYAALVGLYLAGVSARWASIAEEREAASVMDWIAVAVFAGVPLIAALSARAPADVWANSLWAVGLALIAIAAGVVLRVRGYLFGGVTVLVVISVWRSFFVLVEFWWVVLGLIGIAMLVIALTWERQQVLLKRTGSRLQEMLGSWR